MNAERRKRIEEAVSKLHEAVSILEEGRNEEQDYHDNMPESLQDGENGERAEEAVGQLEEAISSCESAIEEAESAIE